jgi:hypothetical protein
MNRFSDAVLDFVGKLGPPRLTHSDFLKSSILFYCHAKRALEGTKPQTSTCARDSRDPSREARMAQQQLKSVRQLDKVDPVWSRIPRRAEEARGASPSCRASSILDPAS